MASTPEDKRAKLARLLREKTNKPKLAPVSFAQERFWFLDQWSAGAANLAVTVRLAGELDREALERSLEAIVQRHETLRTTFAIHDGRPVQVIAPSRSIPTPFADLGASPPSEREREARSRIASEAERLFDLTEGPLFRTLLIRLGAREHMLSFSMHHIISDGWSTATLSARSPRSTRLL